MSLEKYKRAWRYFRAHKFTPDEKRNLRLGLIVSLYGITFAVEKLLLHLGTPLSDGWWAVIYGTCALFSTVWWFEDAILDLWEQYTTEDDILYNQELIEKQVKVPRSDSTVA